MHLMKPLNRWFQQNKAHIFLEINITHHLISLRAYANQG